MLGIYITAICEKQYSISHNLHAAQTVKAIALRAASDSYMRHPSFWKVKLGVFHLIMLPQYIMHTIVERVCTEMSYILALIINPNCNIIGGAIYLSYALQCLHAWLWLHTNMKPYHDRHKRNYTTTQLPPFPKSFMVLSSVMLSAQFVQYMHHMGIRWSSLTSWVHMTAMHGVDTYIYKRKMRLHTIAARMDHLLYLIMAIFVITSSLQIKAQRATTKYATNPCSVLARMVKSTAIFSSFMMPTTAHLTRMTLAAPWFSFASNYSSVITSARTINYKPMTTSPLKSVTSRRHHSSNTLCLTTEVLALANNSSDKNFQQRFSFIPTPTEFGADNCATQHICSQSELFTTMSEPSSRIGVKGVSGCSTAAGIGSIRFSMIDSNNIKHIVDLDNVIYLPEAAKNLISTSQWSREKHDNCGILSRGTYSIFLWGNDKFSKVISHHPGCEIPLMTVNEQDDAFALFTEGHANKFEALLQPMNPKQKSATTQYSKFEIRRGSGIIPTT